MNTPPQDMLDAAKAIIDNAYAPYSHFPVAVCVRADNDELFVGCNVENAAFPVGNCAEASAISAMITAGQTTIKEVLIFVPAEKTCSPCGACRQRLIEFSPLEAPVHLCTAQGDYEQLTLKALLPFSFGPKNLE